MSRGTIHDIKSITRKGNYVLQGRVTVLQDNVTVHYKQASKEEKKVFELIVYYCL